MSERFEGEVVSEPNGLAVIKKMSKEGVSAEGGSEFIRVLLSEFFGLLFFEVLQLLDRFIDDQSYQIRDRVVLEIT